MFVSRHNGRGPDSSLKRQFIFIYTRLQQSLCPGTVTRSPTGTLLRLIYIYLVKSSPTDSHPLALLAQRSESISIERAGVISKHTLLQVDDIHIRRRPRPLLPCLQFFQ